MNLGRDPNIPAWIKVYIGVAFLPLLVGFICMTSGCHEYFDSAVTGAPPQVLTCAELGEQGYSEDLRVKITDFRFLDGYVYEKEASKSSWDFVVAPIVPIDQEDDTFLVAIRSREHKSEAAVERLFRAREIVGILRGDSLDSGLARELRAIYPGVPMKPVIVVEVGGHHMSRAASRNLFVGGGIAFFLGLVWIISGYMFANRAAKKAGPFGQPVNYQPRDARGARGAADYDRRPGNQYDTTPREQPPAASKPRTIAPPLSQPQRGQTPPPPEIIDAEIIDAEIVDDDIAGDDWLS